MSEKKFTPAQVVEQLRKSLTEVLKKADPVLSSILEDLKDKNSVAQVPKEDVPAPRDGVLYKIDGAQQPQIKAPSLKNNVPPNYSAMKIQAQAPKPTVGMAKPKKPGGMSISSKLKGFMQKREDKIALKKENEESSKLGSIARLRQEMSESQGAPIGATGLVPKVKQDPVTGKKTVLGSEGGGTVLPFKVPKISLPKDTKI